MLKITRLGENYAHRFIQSSNSSRYRRYIKSTVTAFVKMRLCNNLQYFSILTGFISLIYLPLCHATGSGIDGYLSSFSVSQGQSINLYTSTTSPTYDLKIYRLGTGQHLMKSFSGLQGTHYSVPASGWTQGAQWANPVPIHIANNWTGGLYRADLKTPGYTKSLNFSVKDNNLGSKSKILLLDNATTKIAYNNWGGKSLYTFNSSDNIRANSVSLQRPGQNFVARQQREFTAWTENMHIPIEHASMMDLQNNPSLLNNYDTVVLAGHSEYWTKGMRNAYDHFVQNGGNAMILSGNTMWWQIRLQGDQQVAYKNAANDPLNGVNNALVTTNWYKSPVNDPENRSTGVSWRNAGYVNSQGFLPASAGYGGYTVTDANNWIYNGTNLKNGDVLGQKSAIVGYETDGALFNWQNGAPVVTGKDGTPSNFDILGYSPTETLRGSGNATMGVFQLPNGGTVFNAATINWADGLWNLNKSTIADNNVSIMTYNALKRFSATVVPLPPAFFLFISGLVVLVGTRIRFSPLNKRITECKTSYLV